MERSVQLKEETASVGVVQGGRGESQGKAAPYVSGQCVYWWSYRVLCLIGLCTSSELKSQMPRMDGVKV